MQTEYGAMGTREVKFICGTIRADIKRVIPIQHLGPVESAVIGFMLTLLCKQMTEESFTE